MQRTKVVSNQWLKTTKEFYRWKKTPDFEKWRKKQFLKQGGLCWYCQVFLPVTKQNVEHKTARSLGGNNSKSNLVLACSNCNKAKGSKPLSPADRAKLNKQNKNSKGKYLKNKQWFDNTYGAYSENTILEKLKDL